jgi:hypothetical protein
VPTASRDQIGEDESFDHDNNKRSPVCHRRVELIETSHQMEFDILFEILMIRTSNAAPGDEATNLVVDESRSKTFGQFVAQIDRRKHVLIPHWSSDRLGQRRTLLYPPALIQKTPRGIFVNHPNLFLYSYLRRKEILDSDSRNGAK